MSLPFLIFLTTAEPEEEPPHPLAGGASRMLRGLMLCMKQFFSGFFNVFKIIVKIFVHNEIYR